jgi:serine/threonine-protein kinase
MSMPGPHHSQAFRLPAGTRLNGIYEIDVPIASGGMGEIYRGHNIQTGDLVAIKVMRHELAENEAALALFRKEASALHHLYHEAIVRYHVFAVEPDLQRPYLAMEFVQGEPLVSVLDRGPLAFEVVWDLKNRLALGLQAAHSVGIIHRDVSPDNVLLPDGDVRRAKIIDFGIARSTRLDSAGTVIGSGFAGKYSYVSPEQLGMFGGDVTAKSDIYSLGLVLAEAITGRPIDMGQSHFDSIVRRRVVPDLGAIDGRLRPLLERMLQPDPAQRPASMADVAAEQPSQRTGLTRREEKKRKRETKPPTVAPVRPQTAARKKGGGMRIALALLALAVLAGGGGAAYMLLPSGQAALPPEPKFNLPKAGGAEPSQTAEHVPPADKPARPNPPIAGADLRPPASRPNAPSASPEAARPGPKSAQPGSPPAAGPAAPSPPTVQEAKVETPAPVPTQRPAAPMPVPKQTPAPLPLPQSLGRDQQFAKFIAQYDGGECFFLLPVALNLPKPRIDGFGATLAPFQAFDTAFTAANKTEADIGVIEVARQQCPALTFLSRLRGLPGAPPRLAVDKPNLRGGEALTGTLAEFGTRTLAFLYISDTGTVHNLTSLLRPEGDTRRFKIPLPRAGSPGTQPELLIALASDKPLDALRPAGSLDAAAYFPPLLSEAQEKHAAVGATAVFFKLER